MRADRVHIRNLDLRVSGLSPQEAARLGTQVARLLAQQLPRQARPQELGALEIQVSARAGAGTAALARRIAQAVQRSLR